MSTKTNISNEANDVNELLESGYDRVIDGHVKQIREETLKKLSEYQKTLSYMAADAPIGILCLPKVTEHALAAAGCLRIFDMLDRDLTKIEGLSDTARGNLTSRLNQFLSMSG